MCAYVHCKRMVRIFLVPHWLMHTFDSSLVVDEKPLINIIIRALNEAALAVTYRPQIYTSPVKHDGYCV